MSNTRCLLPLLAALILLAPAPAARAAAGLNVDFGTHFSVPSSAYGAASGQAGTWNQVGLGVTALADVTGAVSGASVEVVAGTDTGFAGSAVDDDGRLLDDNFFSSGGAGWSVDVSGLAAGNYLVFLYAPTNGAVSTGAMTVDGVAVSSLPGDTGSALVQGTSWVAVPLTFGGGTLAISGSDTGPSGLAGLQLVPLARTGLNVDFGSEYGVPAPGYGAASGQAGTWNEIGLGTSALVDVTGAASGASVSVVASFDTGFGSAPADDDGVLLNDNFFSSSPGASWSVSISGLAAGDYLVFLYAPTNGVVSTGDMTVDGIPAASLPGDGGAALVEGTSWARVAVSFGGGTLAIAGTDPDTAGLAGLQVVPLATGGVNVDFGSEYGVPAPGYGAASGQAGTWNEIGLGTSALVDVTGAASGASVSVVASFDTGFGSAPADDDGVLLNDNFFSSSPGASWSVSISGLAPAVYRVFLYAPTNGVVSTGAMTVDGIAVPSLPGDGGSALVEGTSWASVPVIFAGGTLEVTGSDPDTAGLAGLQVEPLPEPGQGLLLGSGGALVALLARHRGRRRPGR